ncbi:MAG: cardiolipin synthase B [Nitriliruptorales bacterium]|nr:cardiolipin synthase B [Nitriliruptorales bacterium]
MPAEAPVEQHYRRVLEGLIGVHATQGNAIDVLRNGDEIFPAMLDAIRAAKSTVDLCTYVYWTGQIAFHFADALSDRARAGVRVRVLLDAVGAKSMNRDLVHQMEDAGCQVEWFRNPRDVGMGDVNNRTHRKVLVCDEEVGFTGGVGIAEEWEGDAGNPSEWRDTHFKVRGPAVDGLRAAFLSNWAESGRPLFEQADRFPDQPQPGHSIVQVIRCPSVVGWGEMATVLIALLRLARHQVRLTCAYFIPDESTSRALREAVERGVVVDVLVPGDHVDKRVVQVAGEAEYEDVLDAGVTLHRYQRTMLHAKILTVDGCVACVGSANFDPRSLGINEEANLVIFDRDVVALLDRQFTEDLRDAEVVDAEQWRDRGPLQKAAESVTRIVNDQL